MGKKGFFEGKGTLKLDREIEKEREVFKKEGNKGFMNQLNKNAANQQKMQEAEAKRFNEGLFRGQDVAPQRKPERAESGWMKEDPSAPKEQTEQGAMTAMQNFRLDRKGVK